MPPSEDLLQKVQVKIPRNGLEMVIYEIQSLPSHVHFKTNIFKMTDYE